MMGGAAALETLKDEKVQQCIAKAFGGDVPGPLQPGPVAQEECALKAASGQSNGSCSIVGHNTELVLNRIFNQLRDIVEHLAHQSADGKSMAEEGELSLNELMDIIDIDNQDLDQLWLQLTPAQVFHEDLNYSNLEELINDPLFAQVNNLDEN